MAQVQHAIKIFYKKFNINDYRDKELIVPHFHSDQSRIHTKRSSDALNVRAMNKGGKNCPIMTDGYYFDDDGNKIIQKMYFYDENNNKIAKGLQRVLEERGCQNVNKLKLDECRHSLSKYTDFVEDSAKTI